MFIMYPDDSGSPDISHGIIRHQALTLIPLATLHWAWVFFFLLAKLFSQRFFPFSLLVLSYPEAAPEFTLHF